MTLNISFLGFWYLPQYVIYAKILTWHKITYNNCMVIVKPYLHYTSQFMQNTEFFPSWVRPCVHSIIKVKVKKRVIYCFGTCIGIQHLSLARISLALVIFFFQNGQVFFVMGMFLRGNMRILVLITFRGILFALSHCTKQVRL